MTSSTQRIPRPTMPGINSRAVGMFRPEGPRGYVAIYDDGTAGPLRTTRPEAEQDYAAA